MEGTIAVRWGVIFPNRLEKTCSKPPKHDCGKPVEAIFAPKRSAKGAGSEIMFSVSKLTVLEQSCDFTNSPRICWKVQEPPCLMEKYGKIW